jgi:hypothetical protein
MRLSYSQEALVGGGGVPVLAPTRQQPRQLSAAAQVEPVHNPGQRTPAITATPRPPGSYPQAIWWLTGRHPEATPRLP